MSEFQASSLAHFDDAGDPADTKAKESELAEILSTADNAFEYVNGSTAPEGDVSE